MTRSELLQLEAEYALIVLDFTRHVAACNDCRAVVEGASVADVDLCQTGDAIWTALEDARSEYLDALREYSAECIAGGG